MSTQSFLAPLLGLHPPSHFRYVHIQPTRVIHFFLTLSKRMDILVERAPGRSHTSFAANRETILIESNIIENCMYV